MFVSLLSYLPSLMMQPTDEQIKAAIEWHLHFIDTEQDPAQDQAFQAWLAADGRHQAAWATLASMHQGWQAGSEPAAAALQKLAVLQAEPNVFASARPYLRQQAKRHKQTLASAVLLCLGLGVLLQSHWGTWLMADHRSGLGERQQVRLADGSELILGSDTAIDVAYTDNRRQITLLQGTVYARVAKNPQRPFVIVTEHGQAQALGTAFSVQRTPQQTAVTVVESRVRSCVPRAVSAPANCADLGPNQRSVLSAAGVGPVMAVEADDEVAWTQGQLVAKDMPLSVLLQHLNQHHRGLIRYDEAQMRQYRISGVFPLNDAVAALRTIQSAYPIQIGGFTSYYLTVSFAD